MFLGPLSPPSLLVGRESRLPNFDSKLPSHRLIFDSHPEGIGPNPNTNLPLPRMINPTLTAAASERLRLIFDASLVTYHPMIRLERI